MKRLGMLALASGLLLAACSTGGGSAVQPFSDVQATEFVFEADPTNLNRSIFRVVTTEPMICAIVWGETKALGNFNNSLAMNGTGITNHDVFLPGAVPGVVYYFKVQGSTADGTLYESELATFTIPEEEGSVPDDETEFGVNLSLLATVVEASSEFSASWGAGNAIDGDESTEWATSGDGDQAFITIDFGSAQSVAGFEFITRSMADGTAVTTEYTVTLDDANPVGPFPAGNLVDPMFTALDVSARIIRFDVFSSTGGNTGAIEIRVLAGDG